jgi:alkanesulfonate monooxygenase SsuD/methylene tetrahydromethanopterin reductase-like flavin-dependent oxidoreductase (luciferase family)
MSNIKPLILGVALDAGAIAYDAAEGWRDRWTTLFAALDGVAEFATIEDGFARTSGDGPDATLLANWLAPRAPRIGLIAGAALNFVEPFHVSTAIATLDYVSEGRAGLLAQRLRGERVGEAVQAIGALEGFPRAGDEALDRDGTDAIEVIRRLWDSWEDDAVIRDPETQRYLDGGKLHYVDFRSDSFKILGPSITPRPPQGQPVVAAHWAKGTDAGLALAADLVIVRVEDIAAFRALPGAADKLVVAELDDTNSLFAAARAAAAAGAGALRITLSGALEQAARFASDIAPSLRAAGIVRPAGEGPLRQRFGLPATPNRYATAA